MKQPLLAFYAFAAILATTKMTQTELADEWRMTYETRLGILCEDREPTQEQRWIAIREANAHIQELTSEQAVMI